MLAYTQYTFPQYKADSFHIDVASYLTKIVDGNIKHLMLFIPPQYGTTELVSIRLPPYWLAHNPDMPVALVSNSAQLAHENNKRARDVFESRQYIELFPHMEIGSKDKENQIWRVLDRSGYVLAFGVGGAICGHGFGLGIIDNPIKNWVDGQSEALRERVWQWWLGSFRTHIWEDGRIVIATKRLHIDDLAGRILRQEGRIEEGGKWTVVSYPAFAYHREGPDSLGREVGDPLAPSRFPEEYLNRRRNDLGPEIWSAEYQQRPWEPPQERISTKE